MTGAQRNALKVLKGDVKRLGKRFQALHRQTGYEDLGHGVLALEIAEHTVEETLEHTGLGGEIHGASNAVAYRQAQRWQKTVRDVRGQAAKFLRRHPSEDLETALKALQIAEGSLHEVTEHYE